ncbi:hypothetical protein AO269_08380 [Pseudomonas putida]|nr:hypothetical protein AO269_08380 [Pseudomonas putida]
MDFVGPPEKDLADLQWAFEHLRSECIWLQELCETCSQLYESGQETLDLLDLASSSFFRDHNWMIIDLIRLNIWKITDRARDGKQNENLTIRNINGRLEALGLQTEDIKRVSDELHRFRGLIDSSRSKIIAHADLQTIRNGKALGGIPEGEFETFQSNLQAYNDLVGIACGIGPLHYTGTGRAGDVDQLLSLLAAGLRSTSRSDRK